MNVARINTSAVKGFRLRHPEQVSLGPDGVADNRRFFVVGADGERLRSSTTAWLSLVAADWDTHDEVLRITLPDGTTAEGDARGNGEAVHTTSGSLEISGRVVHGPWEQALSDYAGVPLRLARSDRLGVGLNAPVTLVSDGSLRRLAAEAGVDELDSRRFRMLFELDGCREHEEDEWEGRLLRTWRLRSTSRSIDYRRASADTTPASGRGISRIPGAAAAGRCATSSRIRPKGATRCWSMRRASASAGLPTSSMSR
ncbi:MAG TPA: hypothetical protein VIU86_02115, partial [Gaiellaceae bacterium]